MKAQRRTGRSGRQARDAAAICGLLALAVIQASAFTRNPVAENLDALIDQRRAAAGEEAMEFALINVYPELLQARRTVNDFELQHPDRPLDARTWVHRDAIDQTVAHFQPVLDELLAQRLPIQEVRLRLAAHMLRSPRLPDNLVARLDQIRVSHEAHSVAFDDII